MLLAAILTRSALNLLLILAGVREQVKGISWSPFIYAPRFVTAPSSRIIFANVTLLGDFSINTEKHTPIEGYTKKSSYIQFMEREFYTLTELVEKTGLCKRTFRRRIQSGDLRAYKFGKEYKVLRDDYQEWRERHAVTFEQERFAVSRPTRSKRSTTAYALRPLAATK